MTQAISPRFTAMLKAYRVSRNSGIGILASAWKGVKAFFMGYEVKNVNGEKNMPVSSVGRQKHPREIQSRRASIASSKVTKKEVQDSAGTQAKQTKSYQKTDHSRGKVNSAKAPPPQMGHATAPISPESPAVKMGGSMALVSSSDNRAETELTPEKAELETKSDPLARLKEKRNDLTSEVSALKEQLSGCGNANNNWQAKPPEKEQDIKDCEINETIFEDEINETILEDEINETILEDEINEIILENEINETIFEGEIKKLRDGCPVSGDRMAEIMHHTLSQDQTSFENISDSFRPSKVIEWLNDMFTDQWIEAKEKLDECSYLEEMKLNILCDIVLMGGAFGKAFFNVVWKKKKEVLNRKFGPLKENEEKVVKQLFKDQVIKASLERAKKENKNKNKNEEKTSIYKKTIQSQKDKIISKIKEKYSINKEDESRIFNGPGLEAYISKCLTMGFYMAIQSPQLRYDAKDLIGKCWKDKYPKNTPNIYYMCKSKGEIRGYSYPAVLQNEKCILLPKVFTTF